MPSIKEELKLLEQQKEKLLEQQNRIRANKTFICGCGKRHKIKDCVAIQTHWYTPPSGCTEGDYWNEGELQIVCPDTDHKNRVLFDRAPWGKKNHYRHDVGYRFKRMYKDLFKEVVEDYGKDERGRWNNYYFNKNQSRFDLCVENEDE